MRSKRINNHWRASVVGLTMGVATTAGFQMTGASHASQPGKTSTAAGALDLANFSGARASSDAFAAVVEHVNPSVVTIFVESEVAGRLLNGGDLPDGDFFGEELKIERDRELNELGSTAQTSSEGESDHGDLGFSLTDIDEGVAKDMQGVVITDVAPGSIAVRTGLRAGNVVLKVDREPVVPVGDIQGIIDGAGPGDNTLLYISSRVTLIYSLLVKCRRTS